MAGKMLLTRRALSELLDVHPMTVTKWESDGMPIARRGRRGVPSKYSLADVVKWRLELARQTVSEGLSLEQQRTRLARAQADRVEMENKARVGQLVDRAQVVLQGRSYTIAWCRRLTRIPQELLVNGFIGRDAIPGVKAIVREIQTEISRWKTLQDVEAVVGESGEAHG